MIVPSPDHVYYAKVDRVIDGDTYVLDVDLGFHVHRRLKVRLHGVDTPENSTEEGKRVTQGVTDLLLRHPLDEYNMLIRSYRDRRSFDRWVCDVWFKHKDAWLSLADYLIENGNAK